MFFIDTLKNAEITLYFKKEDKHEEENYRTVSIFSSFPKVFVRPIHNQ